MRWYILKTLLAKEALRQLADRGGIFLALLLMAAALLLSLFGKSETAAGSGVHAVRGYYVDYWESNSPWIEHLAANRPAKLHLRFRHVSQLPTDADGTILYPQAVAAVQIRVNTSAPARLPRYQILFWQPTKDPAEIAPLAEWFWRETQRHFRNTPLAIDTVGNPMVDADSKALIEIRPLGKNDEGQTITRYVFRSAANDLDRFPQWLAKQSPGWAREPLPLKVEYRQMRDRGDERSMIATGLVVFGVCFFCVYLLPALTCEERERGILLAQALSPASTSEIFLAKFFFYPSLGLLLGAALAGIYRPAVLAKPFFWLSMVVTAIGYLGVGLTIASLARTQRRASMTSLCYMLAITLFLVICQQNNIPLLPSLALEYHAPRMIHAVLAGDVLGEHWGSLVATTGLALGWATVAAILFRRRGWQ